MISLNQLPADNRLTDARRACLGECPRKHQIQYEVGLLRDGETRRDRMIGAYQRGLGVYNRTGDVDAALGAAIERYNGHAPSYLTAHDWGVERETVLNLLNGYMWRWGTQPAYDGHRIRKVVETDLVYDLAIGEAHYVGKVQAVAELWDGRLAAVEYKTTGDDVAPASDYWLQLRINAQTTGAFVAARLMGFPVVTVLHDVTARPLIKPKMIEDLDGAGLKIVVDAAGVRQVKEKKKADGSPAKGDGEPYQTANAEKGWTVRAHVESAAEYGDRLRLDIAKRPEFYFARQEVPRLASDLVEWEKELAADHHAVKYFRWKGIWPRNTNACVDRNRSFRCEFFNLCHNGWTPGDGLPAGYRQVEDIHGEITNEGATA